MEEKEELVSMEEVKLDIMDDKASLDSPVAERFNLEKRFHMNQVTMKFLRNDMLMKETVFKKSIQNWKPVLKQVSHATVCTSARIRKQKIFQLKQDFCFYNDIDPDARIIKDGKGKVVTTINIFI